MLTLRDLLLGDNRVRFSFLCLFFVFFFVTSAHPWPGRGRGRTNPGFGRDKWETILLNSDLSVDSLAQVSLLSESLY